MAERWFCSAQQAMSILAKYQPSISISLNVFYLLPQNLKIPPYSAS
jgi:hypothetical protein